MIKYPRKVTALGSERAVSAIGIQSKLSTCGVLVMGRGGGPSPAGPSPNNPAEYNIYLDGTTTVTPRIGGVTEVMTSPGTGVAIGTAIPTSPWDPSGVRGVTVLGSDRVSSSVKVCGPKFTANNANLPAFGIMYSASSKIMYFYITEGATPQLCYGDEVAWAAGDPTNHMALTIPAGSGSLGNRRDGRTVFGYDDDSEALVVESAGKSGAIILLSGDHKTAIALYIDATNTPKFDVAANWMTYALS
jgi:hypothetical protein